MDEDEDYNKIMYYIKLGTTSWTDSFSVLTIDN